MYKEAPTSISQGTCLSATQPSIPLLEELHSRLQKANEYQGDLLGQIEDKLHNLLNKRTPQECAKECAQPPTGDFYGAMNLQMTYLDKANVRLSQILYHLRELV